jgi:hypothetical protein
VLKQGVNERAPGLKNPRRAILVFIFGNWLVRAGGLIEIGAVYE